MHNKEEENTSALGKTVLKTSEEPLETQEQEPTLPQGPRKP